MVGSGLARAAKQGKAVQGSVDGDVAWRLWTWELAGTEGVRLVKAMAG